MKTGGDLGRMRTITWTVDGDTMIIANDGGSGGDPDINIVSNVYATRADNFSSFQVLAAGKQCKVLLSILEIKSCIIIVIPKEIFIGTIIDNGELEKIIV